MENNHISDDEITRFLFKKERESKLLEKFNEHLVSCKECFDTVMLMQKTISTLSVSSTVLPVFIFSPSLKNETKTCFGTAGFAQELVFTPTLSSDIGYKTRKMKVQLSNLLIEYNEYVEEIDFKFKAKAAGTIVVYNKNGLILKKKLNSTEEHNHKIQKDALVLLWNDNVLYLFFGV